MIKKEYMKPAMRVVKLHTTQMIAVSQITTNGLGGDNLDYDKNGGNQGSAWSRKHKDVWDEDEEE